MKPLEGLLDFNMYTDSDPDDPVEFELGVDTIYPPITAECAAFLARELEWELFFPLVSRGDRYGEGSFFPWVNSFIYDNDMKGELLCSM